MGNKQDNDHTNNPKENTTISTTSIPIQFNRFKKKSLSLLYIFYPEYLDMLKQIKYKKLAQCILKIGKENKSQPDILLETNEMQFCITNLSNTKIISVTRHDLNVWDLVDGKCVKSIKIKGIVALLKLTHCQILIQTEKEYAIEIWDITTELRLKSFQCVK